METIYKETTPRAHSERLYRIHCVLFFAFGLLAGCCAAYAEYKEWLPKLFSGAVHIESLGSAMLGACLTQTAALPLIFVCGLHRTSYFYTSRMLCVCFWFLQGVAFINICIALNSIIASVLFLGLLILMSLMMLRALFVAAQGVALRQRQTGMSFFSYCYHALRLWGALLIVQFSFNLLMLWML